MFGTERLEALLRRRAGATDKILHRVEAALKQFRGAREPFDDATMMAVKISDYRLSDYRNIDIDLSLSHYRYRIIVSASRE